MNYIVRPGCVVRINGGIRWQAGNVLTQAEYDDLPGNEQAQCVEAPDAEPVETDWIVPPSDEDPPSCC